MATATGAIATPTFPLIDGIDPVLAPNAAPQTGLLPLLGNSTVDVSPLGQLLSSTVSALGVLNASGGNAGTAGATFLTAAQLLTDGLNQFQADSGNGFINPLGGAFDNTLLTAINAQLGQDQTSGAFTQLSQVGIEFQPGLFGADNGSFTLNPATVLAAGASAPSATAKALGTAFTTLTQFSTQVAIVGTNGSALDAGFAIPLPPIFAPAATLPAPAAVAATAVAQANATAATATATLPATPAAPVATAALATPAAPAVPVAQSEAATIAAQTPAASAAAPAAPVAAATPTVGAAAATAPSATPPAAPDNLATIAGAAPPAAANAAVTPAAAAPPATQASAAGAPAAAAAESIAEHNAAAPAASTSLASPEAAVAAALARGTPAPPEEITANALVAAAPASAPEQFIAELAQSALIAPAAAPAPSIAEPEAVAAAPAAALASTANASSTTPAPAVAPAPPAAPVEDDNFTEPVAAAPAATPNVAPAAAPAAETVAEVAAPPVQSNAVDLNALQRDPAVAAAVLAYRLGDGSLPAGIHDKALRPEQLGEEVAAPGRVQRATLDPDAHTGNAPHHELAAGPLTPPGSARKARAPAESPPHTSSLIDVVA